MEAVTFDRGKMVSLYLGSVAVVVCAVIFQQAWILIGLPAVFIGWMGTAPNLNLADGCIAQVTLVACAVFGLIVEPRLVLFGGTVWAMWLVGSLELAYRTFDGSSND